MIVTAGKTNVSVYFYIVGDASNTTSGEPVTGLLFSDIETGGSASYARQGAARVDLTLITLASASVAHADGGFILVDDTNMKGLYRCDFPDAAFAAGVDQVILQLVVASGKDAVVAPLLVDLTDVDLRDAVRGGMTSLPNVNAGSAGGVATDTDSNGAVRIVDGTGAREINTNSGAVALVDLVTTTTTATNLSTNNDKTGYALSAAGVDAIWDETLAGHTTADTAGLVLNDWQDGGRLDLILDAIPTTAMRGTDSASTHSAGDVWGIDATTQQTAGTFGQAIGDPVANTETIYDAVVTDAAGINVAVDIVALKAETVLIVADTNELQTDWVDAGRLDAILDARASQATVDAIETDTQDLQTQIGTAGAGLGDLGGMSTAMKAEVNAEVLDVLNTDTFAEPAKGAPGATITLAEKIGFLYKFLRNRTTMTASVFSVYNDDATTVDHDSAVSDNGTTAERSEMTDGP